MEDHCPSKLCSMEGCPLATIKLHGAPKKRYKDYLKSSPALVTLTTTNGLLLLLTARPGDTTHQAVSSFGKPQGQSRRQEEKEEEP